MNEDFSQLEFKLDEIKDSLQNLYGAVSVGNDSAAQLHADVSHLSSQMDILNHSLYVSNYYSLFSAVSLMIMAAMLMFWVGHNLTRR